MSVDVERLRALANELSKPNVTPNEVIGLEQDDVAADIRALLDRLAQAEAERERLREAAEELVAAVDAKVSPWSSETDARLDNIDAKFAALRAALAAPAA